jgi:hypothetical protein
MGVAVPSYTTAQAFGWNVITYSEQEQASYRTKVHDFLYQDRFAVIQASNRASGTQTTRFQIDTLGLISRAGGTDRYMSYGFIDGTFDLKYPSAGTLRVQAGGGSSSPTLQMFNQFGQGYVLKFVQDGSGAFLDLLNLTQDAWGSFRAASFVETSDARTKHDITDWSGDAVSGLRVRRFTRNGAERAELGFVAQEVREVLPEAVTIEADMLAIHPTQILAATVARLQQVDARLAAIEKKGRAK